MKTIVAFLVLACLTSQAYAQADTRTTLDGVFSSAQAERGRAAYANNCSVCHGESLAGVSAPSLTGSHFLERWRESTLDVFFDFIRKAMPPRRQANVSVLSDAAYLDIAAFILSRNEYKPGAAELTRDTVSNIAVVGKAGPQPVPDGALILTAGCLKEMPDASWVLERATEPVRTQVGEEATPAERSASLQSGQGRLIFRLVDFEAVPQFTPADHKGNRVQAKGYLVRQPNAERISLSFIEALGATCEE